MTRASYIPTTPGTTRMLDIGGVAIHARIYDGNGPEVLLIHGIGAASPTWFPIIDTLARHVTPITIDLRGHGLSGKPDAGYRYNDYATDLDALITELGLERPIVLGHSLGGMITLWWAMQHPGKARALMIEDSPLETGFRFRPALDGWILLNALPYELIKLHYAREHPDWPEHLVEIRSRIMKVAKRAVFTELRATTLRRAHLDDNGAMSSIQAPVLYVHGTPRSGSMVEGNQITDLPNHLAQVEIVHIPDGSHTMHRDQPEAFLDEVLLFLQRHDIIAAPGMKEHEQ
jgi:pimeloyl-ACP methyl ester carboxylesterase